MTKIICFDLEGPLSPQDNAYEVMKLIYNGDLIFEVISKYDDYLTLRRRAGYEPGDTLALIVPFLLSHGIVEEDIKRVSDKAKIVDGSKELISMLKGAGWKVYIISTSYEQHAHNIGARLGVPRTNIRCTKFKPEVLRLNLSGEDETKIYIAEEDILNLHPYMDDEGRDYEDRIVARLDKFYFRELPKSGYGNVLEKVRVVGGEKKVEALKSIVEENQGKLEETIVVGDSITDYKMLDCVRKAGGLAIVFNGNEYAVPYANVGLASTDIRFILPLAYWFVMGWTKVETRVRILEETKVDPEWIGQATTPEIGKFLSKANIGFPYFSLLTNASDAKIAEVLKMHKAFRSLVRGAAAKLG